MTRMTSPRTRLARKRGTAIFVVVMVITLLTAVGIFATRSAALATTSAGYIRQSAQNHYVDELGVLAASEEMGAPSRSDAYVRYLKGDTGFQDSGSPACPSMAGVYASSTWGDGSAGGGIQYEGGAPAPCLALDSNWFQTSILNSYNANPIFPQGSTTEAGAVSVEGAFGPAGLDGAFFLEVTELATTPTPVAGSAQTQLQGTGAGFKYYGVTVTSHGSVRRYIDPTTLLTLCATAGGIAEETAVVAGAETSRAALVVGPTAF